MSLWIWRSTILLEGMPKKTLSSSTMKVFYALVSARSKSSQTLDEWEVPFSLPLSTIRYLFGSGVISSTEVAREAVLVGSVTGGRGSNGDPLLHNANYPLPEVGKGLVLLALIFAYIP